MSPRPPLTRRFSLILHSNAVAPDDATGGLRFDSGGARQLYSSDGSSYTAPSLTLTPPPAATGAVATVPAATALLGGRRNQEYVSLLQSNDSAVN